MTPFRYRDIRENGYFRASEIPFNFAYLDYALKRLRRIGRKVRALGPLCWFSHVDFLHVLLVSENWPEARSVMIGEKYFIGKLCWSSSSCRANLNHYVIWNIFNTYLHVIDSDTSWMFSWYVMLRMLLSILLLTRLVTSQNDHHVHFLPWWSSLILSLLKFYCYTSPIRDGIGRNSFFAPGARYTTL